MTDSRFLRNHIHLKDQKNPGLIRIFLMIFALLLIPVEFCWASSAPSHETLQNLIEKSNTGDKVAQNKCRSLKLFRDDLFQWLKG